MVQKRAKLFAIVITVLILTAISVHAQIAASMKDVVDPVGSAGKVDWTTGVITAVGIGAPPSQQANAAQARGTAERAAQAVAYRNLLEAVKGVRVDSTTMVENFISTSDAIKTQVNGIIQSATLMDKKYMSDGSVEVTVGMKLTGALADALFAKTAPGATSAASTLGVPSTSVSGQLYTGLIVDARGLRVMPALAPKILNEDGKEIYGPMYINRDWAVKEGMVGYLKDPVAARADPRVTDKPFMVKAIKASGKGRVDLIISNADAAVLQSASQNLNMLEKCRVIILVD